MFNWDKLIESKQVDVPTKYRKIERIEFVAKYVMKYIQDSWAELMVIEESGIARTKNIWLVIGIVRQLIEDCEAAWIATEVYSPSSIKKAVTWKGNAEKSEVQRAITEAWLTFSWEDEADAIAIWLTFIKNVMNK